MVKRLRTTSALVGVVMILVGACSSSNPTPSPATAAPATAAPATAAPATAAPAESAAATSAPVESASPAPAVPTVPTGYTELDQSLGADKPFAGKSVDVQVQWTGGELANFQASMADYAKAIGHHHPGRQRPLEPRDRAQEPDRGRFTA